MPLFQLPTWGLTLALFAIVIGATVVGHLVGRSVRARSKRLREPFGVIQAAMLGFMALVLAFGLSLAVGRYENRRAAVVDEANTLGTAYRLAQTIADRLAERAFTVSTVSDGATGRSAVLVRNGAKRYTANALAMQLGGLPVDTLSASETTAADIVVRVGTDFRGLATDLAR